MDYVLFHLSDSDIDEICLNGIDGWQSLSDRNNVLVMAFDNNI